MSEATNLSPFDQKVVQGIQRQVQEVQDEQILRRNLRVIIQQQIVGFLVAGTPGAAPTVSARAPGNLTGNFDWAFSFRSSFTGQMTALSDVLNDVAAGEEITLTGARSTDAQMDKVDIWRRTLGTGATAWILQTTIANPAAGAWTSAINTMDILDNTVPLQFRHALYTCCGTGYRLRKVKFRPESDYDPSATAYWQFWLAIQEENQSLPRLLTEVYDTQNLGLQAERPIVFQPRLAEGGVPVDEFDYPIPENATLYLYFRGIGGVAALPRLGVTTTLTHEEG